MKTEKSFFFLLMITITILFFVSTNCKDDSTSPNNEDEYKNFVRVTGGTFQMGDFSGTLYDEAEALPAHEVTISDYYLCKYLTSNKEVVDVYNYALMKGYIAAQTGAVHLVSDKNELLLNMTGNNYSNSLLPQIGYDGTKLFVKDTMENYPSVFLTWFGAAAYCNFKSEKEGKEKCFDLSTWQCDFSKNGYRLQTEAEYEFAARDRGKEIKYPWINGAPYFNSLPAANLPDSTGEKYFKKLNVWWRPEIPLPWPEYDDGYATTSPVNAMEPNPLGIHDITGNVWEWIFDWFAEYTADKLTDPTGPVTGTKRCLRGGGWWNPDPFITCCARRDFDSPTFSDNHVGFRVAISAQ